MDEQSQNDTITRDYAEQLRKEHDGSKWGTTGFRYSGESVKAVLESRPYIQTALDFGCGKGELSKGFPQLEWSEYDPGIPGKDTIPSGQFDLVTCTDVLEHVEPHLIDNVIQTLAAKTGKVLFLDIACYPTGKTFGEGPYIGQDLHILIKEPAEWRKYIEGLDLGLHLASFEAVTKFSKGAYKDRAIMTYERV